MNIPKNILVCDAPTDVHQDFLVGLVDVVSNCFGESSFVLDYVSRNLT